MYALLLILLTLLQSVPCGDVLHQSQAPAAVALRGDAYRTANFAVDAPDAVTAARVGRWAEEARTGICERWFGEPEPAWSRPVEIIVHREHPGFYATTFLGDPRGEPLVTITLWAGDEHLESTVWHEVCHAVIHLRFWPQDIPRWLDEGIAVCNESAAEQKRQLAPLFATPRRFSVRQLATMTEYPRDVGLFYAQSYSLVDYLVRRHGERQVIRFLRRSLRTSQEEALREVLGYTSFEDLERQWALALAGCTCPNCQCCQRRAA